MLQIRTTDCLLAFPRPQVVQVLKKEIMKTQSKDLEQASEYRQALVQAIHSCAVRFPDVAGAGRALSCPAPPLPAAAGTTDNKMSVAAGALLACALPAAVIGKAAAQHTPSSASAQRLCGPLHLWRGDPL